MTKKILCVAALMLAIICLFVSCGEKHEHEFGEWFPISDSTCTKKGMEKRSCKCGEYETRESDLLEHSYKEWETIQEATCSKTGSKKRKCDCGAIEEEVIPKTTSHDYTDYGCKDCGKFKYNIVVAPLPMTVYDSYDDKTYTITKVKVIAVATYGMKATLNMTVESTTGYGVFLDFVLTDSKGNQAVTGTLFFKSVTQQPNIGCTEIRDILWVGALDESETYTLSFKEYTHK